MKLRTSFLFLLALSYLGLLFAQPFQPLVEKEFEPQFLDYFLSSGQKDFYFSPDGSRLFLTTDLRYHVLDANSGAVIGEGKHLSKLDAGLASLAGILRNRSFSREDAIEKSRFDEGTEYLALPEEGVILMLDWNKDDNHIKALDLETGQIRWQVDRYRYSASSKSQYVDLVLGLANAGRLQRKTPQEIARKNAKLQGYGEQSLLSQPASLAAWGFFTPLPGTGLVLMRIQEKYVALDLKTGAERWVYDQRKLSFGFAEMSEDDGLILVNFNSSYFQANERLILKLDPQTGEEIWTANHVSDFREGRTYLRGDRLICDYYGAEVFDIKTGERILLSIDEKTIKTQNAMSSLFMADGAGGRGTQAIASPSVLVGHHLYTSIFQLGKRRYANDGSSKAIVQKYDLRSGQRLWESDKLSVGTDLAYASEKEVFVRKGKAFGKSSLYILDAQSGRTQGETKTIDGFIYREGTVDILTEAYLYRGGKKNIYAFAASDWDLKQTYDAKGAKVGKLQVMVPAEGALMSVGDKGVVFFDGTGKAGSVISTPMITGSFWNDTYGFLITNKRTLAIDLAKQSQAGQLNWIPNERTLFLFSETGDRLAIIRDGQYVSILSNS
ncbi:MAG: hypothetical protein AAF399_05070 [Bacteroidota bacterium]